MTNQIVLEAKAREPNKVDELLSQIKKIQEACEHDFKLLEELKLKESLVQGVFIGDDMRGIRDQSLKVKCTKCSLARNFSPTEICFKCLGKMIEGHHLEEREKYHGRDDGYNRSRIYFCANPDCPTQVVIDEFDQ